MNQKTEPNRPEKKFRAGSVAATVWANEIASKTGEKVTFKTITLERSYKDKDGKWKNTGSFRINDLPRAALVLNKAYEYLVFKEKDDKEVVEEIVDSEENF
jgi:hypothetical protein